MNTEVSSQEIQPVMDDRKIAHDFCRWAKKQSEWIHSDEGKASLERMRAELSGKKQKVTAKDIFELVIYIITFPLRIVINLFHVIFDVLEK